MNFTRFYGHLERLDRDSRQEVMKKRWGGFVQQFKAEAVRLAESVTMPIAV